MSAEYSVEKIEESVTYLSNQYARSHDRRDAVACVQLQILAERIKADEGAVTDEVIRRAAIAYHTSDAMMRGWQPDSRDLRRMREALLAIWPKTPAQAAQAALSEALNALEDAAVNGHKLLGDDALRFRALVDRIAPTAEPVAQADGMCNADNPARRCVCREEFGRRVCAPVAQGEAAAGLMSSEGDYTVIDCPACGRCVKYSKKDASSKAAYRDLCAEVSALRAENDSLRTLAAQPRAVSENCLPFTNEVIDKMQDVMADHGFTVPVRVISDAFRTTRVALLAAAPSPGESE